MPEAAAAPPQPLTEDHCVPLLRRHGVTIDRADVQALGGGVSNRVFAVADAERRIVVKQSMEKLRVAEDWRAPLARVLTEAAALELAHDLTPSQVPELLFADPDEFTLALRGAPAGWRDWKAHLLEGKASESIARRLGDTLAIWHSATRAGTHLPRRFFDSEPFELLRIDPYYRTTAGRVPQLRPRLHALIDDMKQRQACLVHGDFSPKNVLVDESQEQCWVIDFEVAHYGDPSFDLAFLLTHLLLKSLHRPADSAAYDACARAFVSTYTACVSPDLVPDMPHVARHVGALLAARVRGKSPAEYLDERGARRAMFLAESLLAEPSTADIHHLLQARDEARTS